MCKVKITIQDDLKVLEVNGKIVIAKTTDLEIEDLVKVLEELGHNVEIERL